MVLAYRCVPLHVVMAEKISFIANAAYEQISRKFIPPTTCKQATRLNMNTGNYLPNPDIMIRETLAGRESEFKAKLQHLHAAQCLIVRCRTGD